VGLKSAAWAAILGGVGSKEEILTRCILALDQGTTSSRAIAFDRAGRPLATKQQEFPQLLPRPGWVEHDPKDIWDTQLATARGVIEELPGGVSDVAALGVTNQRETTLLWDRATGRAVANAVVWQSRVSAPICERLQSEGLEDLFRHKTGLRLDPYFSGTKLRYLLDQDDRLQAAAERGELLFGTVDTFLIWRLSGGRCHVTDVSNASRTLLFNIQTLAWDDELLEILNIPRQVLPQVQPSSGVYGHTDPQWFGESIPIAGDAGDQQAALFGQGCFEPGTAKNTYGTGCFLLLNTGPTAIRSQNQLLTTVGWQLGETTTYCLEGSVFVGGAVVQWLRDGLGLVQDSADVERLAGEVNDSAGVVFVPAFVGLGAPYWDPYARGAILGITRGTRAAHIARAAIESMAFQTRDVLDAMQKDAGIQLEALQADGGAAGNDLLLQFQSDLLGVPVLRARVNETTALGAAFLAGLAVGLFNDLADLARCWQLDRRFEPRMSHDARQQAYKLWKKAVQRTRAWEHRKSIE
jgi:glycerol kinase